jgi:ribosome maturation factor RimP
MAASTSHYERFSRVLRPVAADSGYDLEEVRVEQAGRRSLVRVVVDRDGGVSLDECADLSRAFSSALDEADVWQTPYTLEVSSPGVDRPLTEPKHWRRATGRLVKVSLPEGGTLEGRITSADGDGVVLEVSGTPRHVPWSGLGKGKVQVEFAKKRQDSGESGEEEA